MTVASSRWIKAGAVALGFLLAWSGHLFWDLPWLSTLANSGQGGIVLYTIVKAVPFLILLALLVVFAERDVRSFFHAHAAGEIDNGTLTDQDVAELANLRTRVRARRAADDHRDRQRMHHRIRAEVDLVRLHIHGFEDRELFEAQRGFITDLRSDIRREDPGLVS